MVPDGVRDGDALGQIVKVVTLGGFEVGKPEPFELAGEIADFLVTRETSRRGLGDTELAVALFQDPAQ
ncbi:hypothetical protein [Streptomyces sp. SLBN-115]|uniref:hypothetical protein n=1 Tax=Streptomyces sp. SLBN-115 TaxID=2768453 RepID=UPI001150B386|nr:hypothetical protein [Streptomyces sp. SLBN-115]TQJ36861.1 hypothetical protein FBY34_8814 [Streptomyces sp. SLBN-115]